MKTKHIIFVHGWASGPYVWMHQASYFKDKCRVHTPHLAGYGSRALPRCAGSGNDIFDYMVKDISDFVVNNKLEEVCLVGWSMGGMVALKLAVALKGRVNRLVLIGTTVRFVRSEDFKCGVSRDTIEKIYYRMKKDFHGTLDWFYKFCFSAHERSRGEFSEIFRLLGDFIAPLNEEALLSGLKLLMELDMRYLLKDITASALIIHGRQDRICPAEAAEFLAKGLKYSKVELIDNAGHVPFLTAPQRVNSLIEEFAL